MLVVGIAAAMTWLMHLLRQATSQNQDGVWHAGTLPLAWAAADAFPSLTTLWLYNTSLSGTLPPVWAGSSSFPLLQDLELGSSSLTGTLPPEWASPAAFHSLMYLIITNGNITG